VIDRPLFAETKELVRRLLLWQVKSKQEAIEWAQARPFEDTEVEIRQVFETADFAPSDPSRRDPEKKEEGAPEEGPSRSDGKARFGLRRLGEDAVIGRRDGDRRTSRHQRGLPDRNSPRLIAGSSPGWSRDVGLAEGAGAGCARPPRWKRWPQSGVPGQPGRLADGQPPSHRAVDSVAARKASRAEARGARPGGRSGDVA